MNTTRAIVETIQTTPVLWGMFAIMGNVIWVSLTGGLSHPDDIKE